MRHEQIDERSREMHTLIAGRLRCDPTLIEAAKANVIRWRKTCSRRAIHVFDEWDEILEGDLEGVLDLLVSQDERATRLRQSTPFVGRVFLTNRERNDIFAKYDRYREPLSA